MNIYLLTLSKKHRATIRWDYYDSFVVVAANKDAARALVDRCDSECRRCQRRNDPRCAWRDVLVTDCDVLGIASSWRDAGIVTASYVSAA